MKIKCEQCGVRFEHILPSGRRSTTKRFCEICEYDRKKKKCRQNYREKVARERGERAYCNV